MGAALPEVAEEAAFGIAELGTLLALGFFLLLRFGWAATFGLWFDGIAAAIDVGIPTGIFGTRHPLRGVANLFRGINRSVYGVLGSAISHTEYAWHKLLSWNAYVLTKTGDEIANVSYSLLEWAHIVRRDISPAAIRAATKPFITSYVGTVTVPTVTAVPKVKHAAAATAATEAELAALRREVAALRASVASLPAVSTPEVAPAVAVPVPLPVPRRIPGLADVEHGLEWARGQVGKLAKLGTVAGIIGLVGASIARLGLPWLKCSRVDRAGRALCGMDQSLLESLLADALLIAGTVSLVEFAEGMQGITAEVAPMIRTFWRAT